VLEANLAGIQLPPPLRPATEQVASV
jgi:hypothetical protein